MGRSLRYHELCQNILVFAFATKILTILLHLLILKILLSGIEDIHQSAFLRIPRLKMSNTQYLCQVICQQESHFFQLLQKKICR